MISHFTEDTVNFSKVLTSVNFVCEFISQIVTIKSRPAFFKSGYLPGSDPSLSRNCFSVCISLTIAEN
jgi:hypothetical protein